MEESVEVHVGERVEIPCVYSITEEPSTVMVQWFVVSARLHSFPDYTSHHAQLQNSRSGYTGLSSCLHSNSIILSFITPGRCPCPRAELRAILHQKLNKLLGSFTFTLISTGSFSLAVCKRVSLCCVETLGQQPAGTDILCGRKHADCGRRHGLHGPDHRQPGGRTRRDGADHTQGAARRRAGVHLPSKRHVRRQRRGKNPAQGFRYGPDFTVCLMSLVFSDPPVQALLLQFAWLKGYEVMRLKWRPFCMHFGNNEGEGLQLPF